MWMTGFRHGACPPDEHEGQGSGEVSYWAGTASSTHAIGISSFFVASPLSAQARVPTTRRQAAAHVEVVMLQP